MHEIQSILCFAQKLTIICTCASIAEHVWWQQQKWAIDVVLVDGGEHADERSEQSQGERAMPR